MNGDGTEAPIPLTLAFCVGDWQPGTAVHSLHTPCCPAAKSVAGALRQTRAARWLCTGHRGDAAVVLCAALVHQLLAVPGLRCTPEAWAAL